MAGEGLRAFGPLRMLIVDDDPMAQEILAEHYRELGFNVDISNNGEEGLQSLERLRPDIILCDRVMPGGSGATMLSQIRSYGPEWQSIAFVFVTGLTDRRDRYAMMDLKPDGYITKPINFEIADPMLMEILESHGKPTIS